MSVWEILMGQGREKRKREEVENEKREGKVVLMGQNRERRRGGEEEGERERWRGERKGGSRGSDGWSLAFHPWLQTRGGKLREKVTTIRKASVSDPQLPATQLNTSCRKSCVCYSRLCNLGRAW